MSSNFTITRICQSCDKEFLAKTTVTRFCSDHCRKQNHLVIKRQDKLAKSQAEVSVQRKENTIKLRQAFKKQLLSTNIYELVDSISAQETHREFLTHEELHRLADTLCTSQIVFRASIFSALTGLRFSDIHTLRWEVIRGSRGNYTVQFSIDKTAVADYLPIPDQAFDLLNNLPNAGE